MSQIQKRREKILAYNSKHDCSPLIFKTWNGSREVTIPSDQLKFNKDGSPNVKQLVLTILEMSERNSSFNRDTNKFETSEGRNRSSLDIWRHAKNIYPDIDVFRIMEVLHKLCKSGVVRGQHCSTVHRAVFYRNENRGYDIFSRDDEDLMWRCGDYKISFNTWSNLHETT
jgi:hypothetical protein